MSRIRRKQAKKLQKRAFPALFELDLYGRQEETSSVKNSLVCTSALKADFFEDESVGLSSQRELFSVGNGFEDTDTGGAGMQLSSPRCSLATQTKNFAGECPGGGAELQLSSGMCSLATQTKNFARERENLQLGALADETGLAGVNQGSGMCSLASEEISFAREREEVGMCSLTHETDLAGVDQASGMCSLATEEINFAREREELESCSLGNEEESLMKVCEETGRGSLATEGGSLARVREGLGRGSLATEGKSWAGVGEELGGGSLVAQGGMLPGVVETVGGGSLITEGEMLGGVGGPLGDEREMLGGENGADLRSEGGDGSLADKYRIRIEPPGRRGFWGRFLGTMFLDTSGSRRLEEEQGSLFNRRIYRPKSGWTETYSPSNREGEYYRYCYLPEGKRQVKTVHIKGGNVNSLLARRRRAEIDEAIALGRSPYEIVELC